MGLLDRLQHAWNVFMNKDPTNLYRGYSSSYRPDKLHYYTTNERSIVTSILTRVSIDAAAVKIRHVKVDDNNQFLEEIDSHMNECFSISANIDQAARTFFQDAIYSMLDEGYVAIVPTDTSFDPKITGSYDVDALRVGQIKQWYPQSVMVNLYNENTGYKEDVVLPKSMVAIIQNPFYEVMNAPNSTLQRLKRKLSLLDVSDERVNSGKLDLIVQLPYTTKTQLKRDAASLRKKEIEDQLVNSPYGIAYIDGVERIIQLNRPVENNLMAQVEYLTNQLLSQLGITMEILNNTADENTMNNYNNRVIEPIVSTIVDEMSRKFLTKTARTRKQSIIFIKDPLRIIPPSTVADIADKLTRNEILTSNDVRQLIGFKPSDDPKANELRNKNISQSAEAEAAEEKKTIDASTVDDLMKEKGDQPL